MSALLVRRAIRGTSGGVTAARGLSSIRIRPAQLANPVIPSRRALATVVSVPKTSLFAPLDSFTRRHIGVQPHAEKKMLEFLGFSSIEAFIAECVPPSIRIDAKVVSEEGEFAIKALSESELLRRAKELGGQNKVFRSFIGTGYYQAVVPPVILRNMLESPAWYTQYSPYQPEIAQGRLESLINFQSLTTSLTGLDIANASLLDEGTAAAEAMIMAFGHLKSAKHTFFVDRGVLPQTVAVVQTRAAPFGIKVVVGNVEKMLAEGGDAEHQKDLIGVLLQYPALRGDVADWKSVADRTHALGGLVACATDFLALTVLKPPGEWGADIAVGNSARMGCPMGGGGPSAAFFACTDVLKRRMPGRLIGLSKDAEGNPAYRLALQTREQHIRRGSATSNICTAQALLANITAMYAVYHGPEGVRQIADKVHGLTRLVKGAIEKLGHSVVNKTFFDTLTIRLSGVAARFVHEEAARNSINLRKVDDNHVGVSFDESNSLEDIVDLLNVFVAVNSSAAARKKLTPFTRDSVVDLANKLSIAAPAPTSASLGEISTGKNLPAIDSPSIPAHLSRTTPILTQSVWNSYHSETDMLRYIHHLQSKDLSLTHAIIPLGSCTMKLNSTASMIPLTWPEFSNMHPFAPVDQAQGYTKIMEELSRDLSTMTGLPGCSLQPNSGAQGEYAGLSVIRAYHHSRGDQKRDVCLIPVSAHGTNPASAVMSGMKVVPIKVHTNGTLDLEDLRAKADQHRDTLSAFMVTYPSTYGVFESGVEEACNIIHEAGGQVYLDGANFNAMIGLTSPGAVGADVCHLNLHKTFGIPHGGGGPGQGPICCGDHLTPFLPGHPLVRTGGKQAIGPISAAPFGSASILTISWAYIKMLGGDGLTHSSKIAMLSANYAMARLSEHYVVKFTNEKGRCAHEFIIDLAEFDASAGLKVMDFAKRLQDFGIHPPTCSWPLSTAMLIEPTESESMRDLDQFCDAMIKIRQEAEEIATGKQPRENNIIKNAPHTMQIVSGDEWDRPYSRDEAAYPVNRLRRAKFWPTVSRVDDSFGDRNLVCECGTVEEYS